MQQNNGTLYVVATPIGNLRDISLRALDIFALVDRIAAEHADLTRHLLSHHGIKTPLMTLHQHNEHLELIKSELKDTGIEITRPVPLRTEIERAASEGKTVFELNNKELYDCFEEIIRGVLNGEDEN